MKVTIDDIISVVRASNMTDAATRSIDPTATFFEQGIDSLDALGIVLRIEEKYGIKIPDDEVEQLDSIAALAAYLNAHAFQPAP